MSNKYRIQFRSADDSEWNTFDSTYSTIKAAKEFIQWITQQNEEDGAPSYQYRVVEPVICVTYRPVE